jgi:spermidine/putrescine-binding protein
MSTRPTSSAAAGLISAVWTPEQALAVFELLDELRNRVWAAHGDQIQDLLQQEQGFAAGDLQSNEPNSDDRSF